MNEAEQLDRLLQVVVQEEIRRLMERVSHTNLNDWQYQYKMYLQKYGLFPNNPSPKRRIVPLM